MRLQIHPADGLADEAPSVRVTGAPAGAPVTLTTAARDAAGHPWESRCRFAAGADGTVDSARDAPAAGSYAGADAAGLIWSMAAVASGVPGTPDGQSAAATPGRFATPADGFALAVTARLPDGTSAPAVAMRRWRAPGVSRSRMAGPGFAGRLFSPPGPGPYPAVILVDGASEAGSMASAAPAALLASRGFVALAIAFRDRGRGGAGPGRDPGAPPAAALTTGIRRLAAHPRVDSRRVGALGSGGGAAALLAALAVASHLAPKAVVAVVPSSAVWWTVAEAPEGPPARIAAPVLFLAGGDDPARPAGAAADALWHRRRGSGHERADRYLTFAAAGRDLRAPITPTTVAGGAGPSAGGTPEGLARSEATAWQAILDFLREHLA